MQSQLVNAKTLKEMLNIQVTPETLRNWAHAGKVPGAHLLVGKVLFDVEKFRHWLKKQEVKPQKNGKWQFISEEIPTGSDLHLEDRRSGDQLRQRLAERRKRTKTN